jgi:hypothetical protein
MEKVELDISSLVSLRRRAAIAVEENYKLPARGAARANSDEKIWVIQTNQFKRGLGPGVSGRGREYFGDLLTLACQTLRKERRDIDSPFHE